MPTSNLDDIIRNRKTKKVLGDPESPIIADEDFSKMVWEAVEVAQWAPFHYPCHESHRQGELSSMMPWRFYVLDAANCNKLIAELESIAKQYPDDAGWSSVGKSKIVKMLASAGAMIQVTWLPDPPFAESSPQKELEHEKRNTEHLAAAGAAVQNLILSAESKDMDTYWSSGGKLREEVVFDLLDISRNEKILGSIFLYPKSQENAEVVPGKLRDKRGELHQWTSKVKL